MNHRSNAFVEGAPSHRSEGSIAELAVRLSAARAAVANSRFSKGTLNLDMVEADSDASN